MYHQGDIIEYNEMLYDGRIIPVRGLVISSNDINSFRMVIGRVSMDMSVFDSSFHFALSDDMFMNPMETPCFLASSLEFIEVKSIERISRRLNTMRDDAFERYLGWMTTQVGHNFLRWVGPRWQSR